ncbi:MAG TPA: hypothetical protein DG761_06330 [Gammaproteobacteria bacterium]|jgi:uncharacterized integral membrane protein|nr:lipopolysaccharide assembly protein LapA domain-containing protein [Arenicellales bacterium]MDP6551497.1 lipopolysaccharide assembly protein LapA domain-containing protein [Arenicellales bacterium]MDP6790989.1 lipopolysaccharide assembly protein LapA domain-containing protein [Arenicellales bacterium]MDP6918535.1 lipopolysaccharide assembly protein LapA domain-containing protein [Arenicellales bacterium]HCX87623.1 hypothetical protein [Gammaproteobacteria bacterium]|tara:strand:- start:563 stop:868 length:306 start_codon:yes stop_codon:yes gene_type:complete
MLKKILTTVVVLIAIVTGITFAAKNPQAISIAYYFDLAWEGPLVLALIAALAVGVLLGAAPLLLRIFRLKRKLASAGLTSPSGDSSSSPSSQGSKEIRARR